MTYSEFLVNVHRMMDGEDVGVSDLPLGMLQQLISVGEERVYAEVRCRHNEKAFTGLNVTNNEAPIPADYESLAVMHFGGKPLDPVSEEWLRDYLDSQPTGDARHVAEAGAAFMFGPAVSDGTAVQGRYHFRYPALNQANFATNALVNAEPNLFIYATLAESAPFFGMTDRLPLWEAKYAAIRDRLNTKKERAAAGGRIKVRPSTRLLG